MKSSEEKPTVPKKFQRWAPSAPYSLEVSHHNSCLAYFFIEYAYRIQNFSCYYDITVALSEQFVSRQKGFPDKRAHRQKGQKHRQKGQKSRQKGQNNFN